MYKGNVQYGSSGGVVKDIQKMLNANGYNLAVDGIFGADTLRATKDFQRMNGLIVDGIVGQDTLGKLQSGNKTSPLPTTKNDDSNAFKYDDFTYDAYNESDSVKQAQAALSAQLAQKPGAYQSQWQSQLDDVINKIMNREKFSYDLNGDALYQQYKDKYIQQGKMAMGDAIGQASAMTGGYGNSYAQSVGQQAYQAQLENLNDIVPELYQMAYDKYNQEGQDLYNQYSMLGTQEEQDYGRYRDSVSDWNAERDYLAGRYDSERTFDYSKYNSERDFAYGQYGDDKSYAYQEHRNAIEDEQWQKEFEEARNQFNQQMAFNREQFDYTKEQNAKKNTVNDNTGNDTSPGGNPNPGGNDQPVVETGFTGKTYDSAVDYMKSKGVPGGTASGMMTSSEWNRRKSSYQAHGQGGTEVKNYSSYQEYLKDYVEYAVETYGK